MVEDGWVDAVADGHPMNDFFLRKCQTSPTDAWEKEKKSKKIILSFVGFDRRILHLLS